MKKKLARLACFALIFGAAMTFSPEAKAAGSSAASYVAAEEAELAEGEFRYEDAHTVIYKPVTGNDDSAAKKNSASLNTFLAEKKELTIKIMPASFRLYGVLHVTSNKTIDATGSTIYTRPNSFVFMTDPTKNIHDLAVLGGTWRSLEKGGRHGSMFQLAYAKDVLLDGLDVNAHIDGHSIEIIACENVTVKNCKVNSLGKSKAGNKGKEEAIQIDLATPKTAPKVANYGSKYVQGQTCKNIYILNNKVYGARAVGVNYYYTEANKYHKNIQIIGNTLHSTTSEAIQYFNVIGGKIKNNKIRTDATRTDSNKAYTVAVHMAQFGKAPSKMKTITVSGNTIYGNRNGIHVKGYYSGSSCKQTYGKLVIKNNTVYCKEGKNRAIEAVRGSVSEANWQLSGNKVYKWTNKTKIPFSLKKASGWK